jgi:hypothetical protein
MAIRNNYSTKTFYKYTTISGISFLLVENESSRAARKRALWEMWGKAPFLTVHSIKTTVRKKLLLFCGQASYFAWKIKKLFFSP